MTDPEDSDRLQALQARIDAAKEVHAPKPRTPDPHSQAQLAWRMVIELVAGLGIGFGVGYGLDALFGTSPFLMIIFIFLGFAAGIKTMMRSAQEVQREREAADAAEDRDPNGSP
ncbi:AtpZ/AtpI family protein [uncultured Tateyamaria sp.]|uniref:AtpZ/AtpI family protein n=1 Tax=Tateyamaria sp. 1078 TaxID=3417464 RepID=UPI00262474E5|nr:AtpZ/AtpI family protein [uncultured Tateyamaria sp.]